MNRRDGGAVDGFLLAYDGFDPEAEGLREALTSTGNGYLCTRGAAEWEDADGVHYPGTYAHGGYNRETTMMGGLPVLNEDLVNLPNWLVLELRIEGEDAITLDDVELLDYRHEYDIRNATVLRHLRFRDRAGRETTLTSRRFVSMADQHHAGIEWTLVPGNWSGQVAVISALDARVSNRGVARYRQLEGRHLNPVSPRTFGPEVIALKAETRQSNLYISQATRTRVFRGDEPLLAGRTLYQMEDYIQQVLAFDVRQGEATRVEKMIAFYTSRDPAVSDTLVKAARSAARHSDFAAAFDRHGAAWDELWRRCDGRVSGNEQLPAHLRSRRRDARARAERRGLPRARVLGRDVRIPVPQRPAARGRARAAHVPLPPDRRGPGGGQGGRVSWRDVPVAERERGRRGNPACPPQSVVGPLGA
jgi:trehalose/maltose hydrolase-like predicted phosphorylase